MKTHSFHRMKYNLKGHLYEVMIYKVNNLDLRSYGQLLFSLGNALCKNNRKPFDQHHLNFC